MSDVLLRALALVSMTLTLGSCASADPKLATYDNNDLELAVSNSAKMVCTCKFVMEMDDEFCANWVRASPDVARYSYDAKAKTVEASAFVAFAAHAHWVDEKRGCVLE